MISNVVARLPRPLILLILLYCSDCHVRMALGQRRFEVLLHPLFFLNLFKSFSINLLNCKHRKRLAQWRVKWLNENSISHQLLWSIDNFELRNPPLRQAPKRYKSLIDVRIMLHQIMLQFYFKRS
jgi:hypothetical protein